MRELLTAFEEYCCFEAVLDLLQTNRSSRNRILTLKVETYPGGLKQLTEDVFDIYPG